MAEEEIVTDQMNEDFMKIEAGPPAGAHVTKVSLDGQMVEEIWRDSPPTAEQEKDLNAYFSQRYGQTLLERSDT